MEYHSTPCLAVTRGNEILGYVIHHLGWQLAFSLNPESDGLSLISEHRDVMEAVAAVQAVAGRSPTAAMLRRECAAAIRDTMQVEAK